MAIDKVKELIKAIKTDPRAQEALQGLVKPADEDGIIRYHAEAAKKLGFDVNKADLREAISEESKERAGKTEAAAEMIRALADDALDQVAGGADHKDCCDTYKDRENCWYNDGCDFRFVQYPGYLCEHNHAGHVCDYTDSFNCGSFMF